MTEVSEEETENTEVLSETESEFESETKAVGTEFEYSDERVKICAVASEKEGEDGKVKEETAPVEYDLTGSNTSGWDKTGSCLLVENKNGEKQSFESLEEIPENAVFEMKLKFTVPSYSEESDFPGIQDQDTIILSISGLDRRTEPDKWRDRRRKWFCRRMEN